MAVRIVIVKSGKPLREITIDQDKFTIGRRRDCDLQVADPAVSGRHAEVEWVDNGYLIRDLDSTNGLHVAGRQVVEYALKNQDLVTIGEHQLRFILLDSSSGEVTAPIQQPTPGAVIDASADNPAHCYLKIVRGDSSHEVLELEDSLVTVGVPGVQVAAVSTRPQGHFIIHVDGGSDRNKTPLVNGEAIGFKSRKLEAGDLIEVADVALEYCVD